MTQPNPFIPSRSYAEELTTTQVPGNHGAHLDVDLANVRATIGQILTNLALLQRDDTALRNGIVTPDSLSTATLALISSGSFNVRGAWETSTAYAVGDVVESGYTSYLAAVAHTSGTFSVDRAAGKWVVLGTHGAATLKEFGAALDGTTDDADAVQSAIDSGVTYLGFPTALGEKMKLGSTLVIENKRQIVLAGESASLDASAANILWYGGAAPVIQIAGVNGAGTNLVYNLGLHNLSIDGNAGGTYATCGIAFGTLNAGYNELIKQVVTSNINISDCRIGAWFGRDLAQADDIAGHEHINWCVLSCKDHGIFGNSGNAAAIKFTTSTFSGNGGSPTSDSVNGASGAGTNICWGAGELALEHCVFTGSPTTADIQFSGQGLKVNGGWSDSHGVFLKQTGAARILSVKGVRHYEGAMSDANTPTSIDAQGNLRVSGYFFGDIVGTTGQSGTIVDEGVTFHSGAPRTVQGTFKGGNVTGAYALTSLTPANGQARMLMGGGARALAHVGINQPLMQLMGAKTALQWLSDSASNSGTTLKMNDTNGQWELYINCYESSSGNYKAHKAGQGYIIYFGADASNAAISVTHHYFADTSAIAPIASFNYVGGFKQGGDAAHADEFTFCPPVRNSDPSYVSGDHFRGSFYYNSATGRYRYDSGSNVWKDVGARTSQKQIFASSGIAKAGAVAGWAPAPSDNLSIVTLPASQTGSTLVLPISGLRIGDTITAFNLIGQIESAGATVSIDASLRKLTAAAADVVDSLVGSMTTLTVTADTAMVVANTTKSGLSEVVAEDETFYILISATTGASCDIALQGVMVTVDEA